MKIYWPPTKQEHTVHKSQCVLTDASWVSPVQQLAAYDSVFHQLDQTQHHLWYSTCHCVCNPNANKTAQSHTAFVCNSLYAVFKRHIFLNGVRKSIAGLYVTLNHGTYTLLENAILFIVTVCPIAIVQHGTDNKTIVVCLCLSVAVSFPDLFSRKVAKVKTKSDDEFVGGEHWTGTAPTTPKKL